MKKKYSICLEKQAIASQEGFSFPVPLTSFIGREQEITTVCTLLRRPEIRLLTLIGPGGVGKTRLGLQVATILARELDDQVCFLSLQETDDPERVLPTIARALGVQKPGSQPLLQRLQAFLQEKRLLLLDNLEQVRDAAPTLTRLLGACPGLKILATSRASLHVSGEQTFSVPPLALPDLAQLPEKDKLVQYSAITLFVERATTVLPNFRLTEANSRLVAEICLHLDGLPLEIELAVPRLKVLSLQTLLERLAHRFEVLTQGMSDAPARHQTLYNNLEWSYRLLNLREQHLFRCLSVFVGGCTLQALETVWELTGRLQEQGVLLDDVTSLLEKSMLLCETQEAEEPRLHLLRTMREYGAHRLALTGELEQVQWAHATYYLALAEKTEAALKGSQPYLWLNRLQREHENLREALSFLLADGEHGASKRTAMALRLAKALERLVRVAVAQGEGIWAAYLLSAAETVRQAMEVSKTTDLEQGTREKARSTLRALLDEQGFVAAWAAGQAMSPEQAVAARHRPALARAFTPRELQLAMKHLPPRSLHNDLTPRERDVLRLVAQGLTDAQVAERLVISHRTVNFHLGSIYSKLEVSSRSAATRYALEHRLC
jgi:predicted ATPase/DNA-binding NarL/FixJ family response regulator